MVVVQYYCFTCQRYVKTQHDYSAIFCLILAVGLGWLFGIGLIAAIIYYSNSPRICLSCRQKNIWVDKPREFKESAKICQNYKALGNGACSHYKDNSCYEIKSNQNLDILNKRNFFCPHQDEKREKDRKEKENQARWVKKFEQRTDELGPQQKEIRFVCPYCNTIIGHVVKFCTTCGAELKSE